MALGTLSSNPTFSRPNARPGGGGRPPLDRPRGGGGGGNGGGDGLPDYGERLRRYRFGLAIALISIVTLFAAMGAAFVFRQNFQTYDPSTGHYIRHWIPLHLPLRILWFDTFVILISSVTLEVARRQAVREAILAPALRIPGIANDHRPFPWLPITVALGFAFLIGQTLAWNIVHHQLTTGASTSDSFFYILTGTHAAHLAAGLFALVYALTLAWRNRPQEQRRVIIDVTSWYWHVIGILWIFLFALLLLSPTSV